jgi:hypothetical protein
MVSSLCDARSFALTAKGFNEVIPPHRGPDISLSEMLMDPVHILNKLLHGVCAIAAWAQIEWDSPLIMADVDHSRLGDLNDFIEHIE